MERFPDWARRLRSAIAERRDRPHAWGQHDCAINAADLVQAQTGIDFAAPFRGRYTDEASAMERLGLAPRLVEGSAQNFKVTYPADFALAEAILRSRA